MRATMLDLRRNTKKIVEAIERNEAITLSMRGREIAVIVPQKTAQPSSIRHSPAIGMWKDRTDMKDPAAYVRKIRKGRFHDL